jgi:hypothetical protein
MGNERGNRRLFIISGTRDKTIIYEDHWIKPAHHTKFARKISDNGLGGRIEQISVVI